VHAGTFGGSQSHHAILDHNAPASKVLLLHNEVANLTPTCAPLARQGLLKIAHVIN